MLKTVRKFGGYLMLSLGTLTSSLSALASENEIDNTYNASKECVILIHGLAKSDFSMSKIKARLEDEGYQTKSIDYPSRSAPIEALAKQLRPAIAVCEAAEKVHFITHSMGGLLLRQYLTTIQDRDKTYDTNTTLISSTFSKLGRVVMLAPPNQGSEVIDTFGDWPLFEKLAGPAAMQLSTAHQTRNGAAKHSTVFPLELGIIAGNKSINPILSKIIPGADDGKVSVENTKLEGMKAHLILPVSHPFITRNPDAIEQSILFIKNGRFKDEYARTSIFSRKIPID